MAKRYVDKFLDELGEPQIKDIGSARMATIPMKPDQAIELATEYLKGALLQRINNNKDGFVYTTNPKEVDHIPEEMIEMTFNKYFKISETGNIPSSLKGIPYHVQKTMFERLMISTMDYLDAFRFSVDIMKEYKLTQDTINDRMGEMSMFFKDINDGLHESYSDLVKKGKL